MPSEKIDFELIRPIRQKVYQVKSLVALNWAKGWHLYNLLMGKQRLKMLVLDLDGTALNDQKEIIAENVQAIAELKKRNPEVLICIATGRGFHQALRYAHEIAADIFITDNGGALYQRTAKGYNLTKSYKMPENEAKAFLAKIGEYLPVNKDIAWHFSTDDIEKNFITSSGQESLQNAQQTFYPGEIFGAGVLQIKDFDGLNQAGLNERVIKACIDFGQSEKGKDQFRDFEAYLQAKSINYFQTSTSKLEIAPANVNKGETLLEVIRHQAQKGNFIAPQDVLALGDSGNDQPMFAKGFQNLCPVNARTDIKNLENVTTLPLDSNQPFVKEAIAGFRVKTTPGYHRFAARKVKRIKENLIKQIPQVFLR